MPATLATASMVATPALAQDAVTTEPATAATADREPTAAELADAHHSFEVAATAYESGDYETAAEEFRAAYEITQHPELLFNVYLAEERAGRPAEAAEALARYLELATAISTEERPLLERRLERLRARAASRTTVPPPAEELDDSALLASPIDDTAGAGGTGDDASDDASEGSEPPTAVSGGGPPVAGVAVLVAGAALLVGFAVLAPLSEVEDQRLASSCGRDATRSCTSDEVTTLTALNIAADVSWIGGAALAAVGVVLLVALPPDGTGTADATVAVAPWAGPDGAGLAVGGTF